jgi:molybdate transport system ATP-binding protein
VPGRISSKGGLHRIRIPASDVSLAVERPSLTTILNVLPVRIHAIEPLGEAQVNIVVTLGHRDGGRKLLVRATRRAQRILGLRVGQDVFAQIKAASLAATYRDRA